jgi:hypothetical protein
MRQPFRSLGIGLLAGAGAAIVLALIFLLTDHTVDVRAEVGKWLLTLAAAFVLTGALSMVVKQIDQRRSEREAWHTVLNDLIAANQTVMLARLRLRAQQSALTYREQLAEIMHARVELRRIYAIGIVIGDPTLRADIKGMRRYLDALGSEYETGYLCVARQQRLDELWLTDQMKVANANTCTPVLPARLAKPTVAWRLLQDRKQFPRLAALLDEDAFPIDTFRTSYKRAKARLEVHAGFENRSMEDSVESASKLCERTMNFVEHHADLPDYAKTRALAEVDKVQKACGEADRGDIVAARDKLAEVAADTIGALYFASERSVAEAQATEDREIDGHPATSPRLPRTVGPRDQS